MIAEKGVMDGLMEYTLDSKEYRDVEYQTDGDRIKLRNRIVDELFKLDLLASDDEIVLGNGGAKPPATKSTQDAFILTGLRASLPLQQK
jgi:hypothetical protein